MFSIVISGFASAQSDNPYVYDEPEMTTMDDGDYPSGPGDPGSVPVDQYIPVLLIIVFAITWKYHKKRKLI